MYIHGTFVQSLVHSTWLWLYFDSYKKWQFNVLYQHTSYHAAQRGSALSWTWLNRTGSAAGKNASRYVWQAWTPGSSRFKAGSWQKASPLKYPTMSSVAFGSCQAEATRLRSLTHVSQFQSPTLAELYKQETEIDRLSTYYTTTCTYFNQS